MPPVEQSDHEFALISEYFAGLDDGPALALGNGDDAALLRVPEGELLAVSTDVAVEAVHFPPDSPAEKLSYRAVAAAVSDLAAMGAMPLGMTLALTLPAVDRHWLAACSAGLQRSVADFSIPLVGGDLARGPLSLTVQVMGSVPEGQATTRCGARVGDLLCVSGTLGDAAAGLQIVSGTHFLEGQTADFLVQRFWSPSPALALGRALRGRASAAIDVSDGLLADAGHIARASAVQLCIDSDKLPLSPALEVAVGRDRAREYALSGGEDFELCFTMAGDESLPQGCTVIGRVTEGEGVICDVSVDTEGYRHF